MTAGGLAFHALLIQKMALDAAELMPGRET